MQPGQAWVTVQRPGDEQVQRVNAPEAQLVRGRVIVRKSDGTSEPREVLVGSGPGAWDFWARELRFSLENTKFVEIGGTIYRSETIDTVDPIRQPSDDPASAAVQVALGALTVIRDDTLGGYDHARQMAAEVISGLEEAGYRLATGGGAAPPG